MKTLMFCLALTFALPLAAHAGSTKNAQTPAPGATPAYIQNEANLLAPY
jgi:hypothetical protein